MKTLRTILVPALLAVMLLGTGFLAGCRENRHHRVAYRSEPTLCWGSDSDRRHRDDRRHAPTRHSRDSDRHEHHRR
ncbi:MAG TPA: hypothetical protein DCX07_13450 [Phycisphaerales bacterium]|nr:hypothetical protein [Phycisphaerales bacterium]